MHLLFSGQWTVLDSPRQLTRDMDGARGAVLERTAAIKTCKKKLGRTSIASTSSSSGHRFSGLAPLTTSTGKISATVVLPEDAEDALPGLLPCYSS